eukprot:3941892-Rhodomonas_salina.2
MRWIWPQAEAPGAAAAERRHRRGTGLPYGAVTEGRVLWPSVGCYAMWGTGLPYGATAEGRVLWPIVGCYALWETGLAYGAMA